MTRQTAYMKHYRMWNELVEHPMWRKSQTSQYDSDVDGDGCFLCAYATQIDIECAKCPLCRASGECVADDNGWFTKWYDTSSNKLRKKYATLIRDCVIPYLTAKSKKTLGIE